MIMARLLQFPIYFILLSFVFLAPAICCADTADDLRKVQNSKFSALVAKDLPAIDSMLAPSLVYTHSNGAVESKEAFINNIRSGKMVYRSIEPAGDRMVTIDGNVGVITGTGRFAVTVGGKEIEAKLRFTDVWVRSSSGEWRELAWQSLRIEPPQ